MPAEISLYSQLEGEEEESVEVDEEEEEDDEVEEEDDGAEEEEDEYDDQPHRNWKYKRIHSIVNVRNKK